MVVWLIVFSHSDQLFNEHLKNVVSVLKFETFYLLEIVDLNHVWVSPDCGLLLLSDQDLLPLLDYHLLLPVDQIVFRLSLQFKLLTLKLDSLLDEFECLRFVVHLNCRCLSQNCPLRRSHHFFLVNHWWWTVRLSKQTCQSWLALLLVILLLYKLNHFCCLFTVSVIDGRLRDRFILWNSLNRRLNGFDNLDWRLFCVLYSMHLLLGLSSLLYHNLGILFYHALSWRGVFPCNRSEFLDIQFFSILLRHFCARNARVNILQAVFQQSLLLSIHKRHSNTHVHFNALLVRGVKQNEVVTSYILIRSLGLQAVLSNNSDINVWACQHFYTKTWEEHEILTFGCLHQWTSRRKVYFGGRS